MAYPSETTKAQAQALKWLLSRNGDGVFAEKSNKSVLVAAGERAPVMRGTWGVLEGLGLVERYGPRLLRLRVTDKARALDLSDVRESEPA